MRAVLGVAILGPVLAMGIAASLDIERLGPVVLQAQENPVPATEESIAAGRRVYVRFCASCHGTSGQGDGAGAFGDVPPANLVDETWDHGETDAEIFETIADGVPPDYNMEEWRGRITDEDIWNIINYLRDLASQ